VNVLIHTRCANSWILGPFFTKRDPLDLRTESDNEDGDNADSDGEDLQNGDDRLTSSGAGIYFANHDLHNGLLRCFSAWFRQPKYMPDWLYKYFGNVIHPLISEKEGRHLRPPRSFTENKPYSLPTMWILPLDPVFSMSRHRFDPTILYRPRIFLWLPHFLVQELYCPNCRSRILEKNGPLAPRRIVDLEDNFYIVSWAYYCRTGCKSYFAGWSKNLLDLLPAYIWLAFPALLSWKGGLSSKVITYLRVSNQHKMGPRGVRSLLWEMHTLRFNRLQLQYLEAIFETVLVREQENRTQTTLHSYLGNRFLEFGSFGDPGRYTGFVPSEHYLSEMMNKAIENDEVNANQHTACLPVDQIALDDSHKVCFQYAHCPQFINFPFWQVNKHIAKIDGIPVFGALWTCMDSRYIRAQALTLTKSHEERLGPLKNVAKSLKIYGYADPPVAFSDDLVKVIFIDILTERRVLTPICPGQGLAAYCISVTGTESYAYCIGIWPQ
jgi:hypothetical protein